MGPFVTHSRLAVIVTTFAGLSILSTPAAAHGLHASDHGVQLSTFVGIAAVLSISAGVFAAIGRHTPTARRNKQWISLVVGVVIIGLGVTAAGSVVVQAPVTAATGVTVGLTVGLAVSVYNGCDGCADMTAGAIGLHRVVEGVAVAGLWAAGTAVGLLGVAIFTGHIVVESVVIGLQQSHSRLRAIGTVVAVTGVFVLSIGISLSGVGVLPTQLIVAFVGGMLIPLGGTELQSGAESWPSPTPT